MTKATLTSTYELANSYEDKLHVRHLEYRRESGRSGPAVPGCRPALHAKLIGGDADFEALGVKVVGFFEAPPLALDLPLDLRGTAFQQRVWQALREIPSGSRASYVDIAKRIGAPKSVRAVARTGPSRRTQ